MNNQNKLEQLLVKIAKFSNLDENQKLEYLKNINQGLVLNFLSDGTDIVSPEILNKLKTAPDQTVIQAYLKEMSESEKGRKIIQNRVSELVNELLESVKDKLTQNQKVELLKILE